jgi:hypothetical protein
MITNPFSIFSDFKKEKLLSFLGMFFSIFVFGFFTTASPAFAMGGMVNVAEINSPVYDQLDIILDAISIILMLIALFYIIKSIHNYGKSTIGIAILYFLNATIVLGAIRLIFILGDDGIIPMQDITETTGWHILLCYSAVVFYFACRILTNLVNVKSQKTSYARANIFMIFSFVLSAAVILSLHSFDWFYREQLRYPWIVSVGIYHIIGIIVTAAIAIYLYRVKRRYKGFDQLIGSMYIAIGLITTICLWELLNEAWKVIIVSDDFGEFIERVLWVPVFIFILLSFRRFLKISTNASRAESQESLVKPVSSHEEGVQTLHKQKRMIAVAHQA